MFYHIGVWWIVKKKKVFVTGTISYMINEGKRYALYQNYMFAINKKYKDKKVFYRCVEYHRKKCRSSFTIEDDTLKESEPNHTHSSDSYTIENTKKRYPNGVFKKFPIEVISAE